MQLHVEKLVAAAFGAVAVATLWGARKRSKLVKDQPGTVAQSELDLADGIAPAVEQRAEPQRRATPQATLSSDLSEEPAEERNAAEESRPVAHQVAATSAIDAQPAETDEPRAVSMPTDLLAATEVRVPTSSKACLACGACEGKLMRCGSCKTVFFCSRDCQIAAWPAHKAECAATARTTRAAPKSTPARRCSPDSVTAAAESFERQERRALLEHEADVSSASAALRSGAVSGLRRAAELAAASAQRAARRAVELPYAQPSSGGGGEAAVSAAARAAWHRRAAASYRMSASAYVQLRCLPEAIEQSDHAVSAAETSGDAVAKVEALVGRGLARLHAQDVHAAYDDQAEAVRLCEVLRAAEAAHAPPPSVQEAVASRGATEGVAVAAVAAAAERASAERAAIDLLAAEASARSNLGRSLFELERGREGMREQRRAVALRRQLLAREEEVHAAAGGGSSADVVGGTLHSAVVGLAQTLCNYAAMLANGPGCAAEGADPNLGRAVLEEARQLACRARSPRLEQAVLTNLLNLASEPADGAGAAAPAATAAAPAVGDETGDAPAVEQAAHPTQLQAAVEQAAHLTQLQAVLRRSGRQVDETCAVCLEALGPPQPTQIWSAPDGSAREDESAQNGSSAQIVAEGAPEIVAEGAPEIVAEGARRGAPSRPVVALGCGHLFHAACLARWSQHSAACPQCRATR